MQDALTLLNENWLGAAMPKHRVPALIAVANNLNSSNTLRFRGVAEEGPMSRQNGIDYHDEIVAQITEVGAVLKEKEPVRLRNVGCDCGTDFSPIAYMLSRYRENLVVVWFDAHAEYACILYWRFSLRTFSWHGSAGIDGSCRIRVIGSFESITVAVSDHSGRSAGA